MKKPSLTRNVLCSVSDVDFVGAGSKRNVLYAAAAIFVVFARHL